MKTYCKEAFLHAFKISPIGRTLTGDAFQKIVGTVSDLKKHIKDLVDMKEKLKEVRLIFLKADEYMDFLNKCYFFFCFEIGVGIQMRITLIN